MNTEKINPSPVLLVGGRNFLPRPYSWYRRLLRPWGMLLSLTDGGKISVGEAEYDISAGTLLVYEPDVLCKFTALRRWEHLWFHFPLRSHMIGQLNYEDVIPGVGATHFSKDVLEIVIAELNEALELVKIRRPGWEALALLLIESVLQRFSYYQERRSVGQNHQRMEKAIAMLTEEKGRKISAVAAACGVSEPLLYALFRREMGCTPRQYREQFLLRKGQTLLMNSDQGIDEIAEECEMCDRYYFSNRFKKLFGISPAAFRKSVNPVKTKTASPSA